MSPAGDDAQPWWSDGLRFTCTRCGRCCKGPEPGYVAVNAEEVARLAEHVGMEPDAFGARYVRRVGRRGYSLIEKPNRDCVFWEDEVGCTVYEARPDQCRTFPFWPELLREREAWDEAATSCPGMNRGRRYSRERIETIAANEGQTRPGRKTPGGRSRG